MHVIGWLASLLLVAGFCLATWLEPWFQSWAGNRTKSANLLAVALGDSRRLFAQHFYVKADIYLHDGYYPSIYDLRPASDKMHMAAGTAAGGAHDDDHQALINFMGPPKDWIDRFSRHFYPSRHRHLGKEDEDHDKPGHEHVGPEPAAGVEREMLPWLKLAAALDPERPETYIVSAYWLRTQMGKVSEAEQFLREGLRANPGNCEMYFELGRIAAENHKDPQRARLLWELALRLWQEKEAGKPEPNLFLCDQILGHLAKLEEDQKNYPKAIAYLEALRKISPYRPRIQQWIDELKAK